MSAIFRMCNNVFTVAVLAILAVIVIPVLYFTGVNAPELLFTAKYDASALE